MIFGRQMDDLWQDMVVVVNEGDTEEAHYYMGHPVLQIMNNRAFDIVGNFKKQEAEGWGRSYCKDEWGLRA